MSPWPSKRLLNKSNELFRIEDVLEALVLTGHVVTTDALHTQRCVAQTTLDGGRRLRDAGQGQPAANVGGSQLLFQERHVVAETLTATEAVDAGHGRIEVRRLTASSGLAGSVNQAGLQQVFEIERTVTYKRTGRLNGAKSSTASPACRRQHASAARLLSLVRQRGTIENKSHWVRDVTYDRGSFSGALWEHPADDGGPAQSRHQPHAQRWRNRYRRRLSPLRRPTLGSAHAHRHTHGIE